MGIFLAEHKKLWCKKYVRISVLLCFVYMIIFAGILQFQWFTFGSPKDVTSAFGNHFDGYEVIRERQEYAEKYHGVLTDETLSDMVSDYQSIEKNGPYDETKKTDWSVKTSWLETLFPELKQSDTYLIMLSYVDPGKLTDIYERRNKAIEAFMDASGIEGDEKEYLLSMNEKVEIPFSYVWTEGWRTVLGDSLPDFGLMIAIVLVVCLAPMFSGEWQTKTGAMILTMKQGWRKDALAKLAVGFSFTIEIFLLIAIPNIIVQMVYLGASGWDAPIQCIKMIAIAPMNMVQAEIYEYLFALFGTLGFAGLVMLISSLSKNDLLSIVGGFALLFVPMVISEYLPYTLQLIVSLIPMAGSSADIFRMNTLNVFGKAVWLPYVELWTPLIFMIACIPVTVSRWAKIQKS